MAENIEIIGVKTANELDSISELKKNTIFVCNDNNTLVQLSYNTLSNDLTAQITGYTHNTYQLISDMTSYTKLSTFNNKSDALSGEIKSLSTALSNDIELSVRTLLSSGTNISPASTSKLGGIKLYGNDEDLESNYQYRLQLNGEHKAYVEIDDTTLNDRLTSLDAIKTINNDITDLETSAININSQIDTINNNITTINNRIDNIDANILRNDVNDLSSSVLDLIETNTYMFGTFMRSSYLSLSANSTDLYNELNQLGVLSIITSDQATYNNLVVDFVFKQNSSNKLNYSISASTLDKNGTEYTSGTVTQTNSTSDLSVLDFGTDNNLVQLECKVDDETFTENSINLTSAIKFLENDSFEVRFVKDADNNNAILQFNDFAEGDKNGYLFTCINTVSNSITSLQTSLTSGTGDPYTLLSAKIYRDLSSQFVHMNDNRSVKINNTLAVNNLSVYNDISARYLSVELAHIDNIAD